MWSGHVHIESLSSTRCSSVSRKTKLEDTDFVMQGDKPHTPRVKQGDTEDCEDWALRKSGQLLRTFLSLSFKKVLLCD